MELPEGWVLYSPSVMYSIAVLIRMFSRPGERVVAFAPMYDAFLSVVRENGRELSCCPLVDDGDVSGALFLIFYFLVTMKSLVLNEFSAK